MSEWNKLFVEQKIDVLHSRVCSLEEKSPIKKEIMWIDIRKEFPPINTWVLTYSPHEYYKYSSCIQVRHVPSSINKKPLGDKCIFKKVTHWLPLPQSP